jgi:2-C-methyl-D-erythritol 4-phosphate cytidylyltransferase
VTVVRADNHYGRVVDAPAPVVAVVLAAGGGTRFGGEVPKQLVPLRGRPMLLHSVAAFAAARQVDRLVIVTAPELRGAVQDALGPAGPKPVTIVDGGTTRTESSRLGLAAISELDGTVLIHDAARPLVDADLVARCLEGLVGVDAVVPVIAATDTIATVAGDRLLDVPDRSTLAQVQTPQAFRLPTIRAAYDRGAADPGFVATDDASVVLRYLPGTPVRCVAGSVRNLKITTPGDLAVAEQLLADE